MRKLRALLTRLGTSIGRLPWRALLPDAADFHIYPGLALLFWGLRRSPVSWSAFVVVGLVLFYMGAIHPLVLARVRNGPVRQS